MLTHLIRFTVNPGPFTAPDQIVPGQVTADIAVTLAFIATALALTSLTFRLLASRRLSTARWVTSAGLTCASVAVGCLLVTSVGHAAAAREIRALNDQAHVAYTRSVVAFLASDYGLTVDERTADQLIAGRRVTIPVNGQDAELTLASQANGDLAVRVDDERLLAPVDR